MALLLTNSSELLGNIKSGDYLGHSSHAIVNFTLFSDMRQGVKSG